MQFVDLKAQYARLKPQIDARMAAVLAHGQFILGPEVAELEGRLAAFAGARHAVAVASGTDALLIALMAEGVGPGDAVFVPAFTFPATAEVVCLLGATPVFVDVTEDSFNIDPSSLAAAADAIARENRLRPRAVIAVDLYGLPADYEAIGAVAAGRGLFVLADAAQSFGAAAGGRKVGALAPATAVSFFPAKPLGCYGDGGAIITEDDARAAAYRSIRAHGKGEDKYDIQRVGVNGRLDTLQAAILLAKLDAFPAELEARGIVADRYDRALAGVLRTPSRPAGTASAWAQYTVRLPAGRDELAASLKRQDVPTAVYYPVPLHQQPAYRALALTPVPLGASERLCREVLSLPMHPDLDEAAIARVTDAVSGALR